MGFGNNTHVDEVHRVNKGICVVILWCHCIVLNGAATDSVTKTTATAKVANDYLFAKRELHVCVLW